jgi:hypothetical protein
MGRDGPPIPVDNVYLIKTADDLPQDLSQWTLYNLQYDPGAGVGLYFSPDGTSLVRLAAGGGGGGVTSFNSRVGIVVPILADYDSFFLTQAEGDALYVSIGDGTLTVEDEGAPLATIADTLDFVGAGVVASGIGGTKTITIPGGGGGGSPFLTPLEVHTVGNVPIGGIHDVILRLTRLDTTPLGLFGFDNSDDLWIKSFNHGDEVRISRENSSGTQEDVFRAQENNTSIKGANTCSMTVGFKTAVRAVFGFETDIRYNDIISIRTMIASSGGAVCNNALTGIGLERILTVSDLGGIGGVNQNITATWTVASASSYTRQSGSTAITQSGAVNRYEDNAELRFGTGDDVAIDFDGTNFRIAGIGLAAFSGFEGFSPGSYIQLKTATDAELNAVANAINTDAGKVQGAVIYNSSTDNPVYAKGPADADVWVDGAGTIVNSPI